MSFFDNIPDEPQDENAKRLRAVAVWASFIIFAIVVILVAKALIA